MAAGWIPDPPGDLIGPGIAIDETAQLKRGEATACVAPQHAGFTAIFFIFTLYLQRVLYERRRNRHLGDRSRADAGLPADDRRTRHERHLDRRKRAGSA